ncbi:phosphotransferase [Saccharomonospora sp.]|uniref:phosphotransferase n=1 Tax=Saccharomonospora sp. TaxID=33913 RepID=UPI00260FEA0E|nr:phosphotransferase [Saccharomonospora sp.]
MDGHPPTTDGDWAEVARQVLCLHELTADYPMPKYAVCACRQVWRALAGNPTAVVHGDLSAHNLRINQGRVGFLDWDEARVDHTALDLVDLPAHDLITGPRHLAQAASAAWEAANGWAAEPDYARSRLTELRRLHNATDTGCR